MRRIVFLSILIAVSSEKIYAQDDAGYIYGKVITKNGNTYVGQIRWGDEEIFWNDIFNSVKTYGNNSASAPVKKKEATSEAPRTENKWAILKIWDDAYTGKVHQFSCRFGDLKEVIPLENGNTILGFKNDDRILVNGGSNDIGTAIKVSDYELGAVSVPWRNLQKIEFFDAPAYLENKPGNPIYGQVKTTDGTFAGFIQWDHDERIDTDILDGYYANNKVKIKFQDIKCIRKSGCSAIVTLTNGSKLQLSGTNDVDCSNRGIIVSVSELGKIEVPWNNFTSLCIDEVKMGSGDPYRSYPKPKRLYGKVKTLEGTTVKGIILFDNDETWDYEHLEGMMGGIKYIIPFRNISVISPKNINYASVTLKNGRKLLLGELQDVSSKNEGVRVFRDYEQTPVKINWLQLDEIIFE